MSKMHTKFAGKNYMARVVADARGVFKWILQKCGVGLW
jgi:hypothetical protein